MMTPTDRGVVSEDDVKGRCIVRYADDERRRIGGGGHLGSFRGGRGGTGGTGRKTEEKEETSCPR